VKEGSFMIKYQCSKCRKEVTKKFAFCPYCKSPGSIQEVKIKKSVLLLISAILGVLYAIYIIMYFAGASANAGGSAEAIGAGIATVLVMPHMICAVLAAIFNVLGWSLNSRGFALTGAILYTVAAVSFPIYAMFVLIQMILSYIGFARLKK